MRLPGVARKLERRPSMPETCGNRPLARGSSDSPFSIARFRSRPAISTTTMRLLNGSSASTSPWRDARARLVGLAGADAAAVEDRGVRVHADAHRVGEQVADRGLARAHGRGRRNRARPRWCRSARSSCRSAPPRSARPRRRPPDRASRVAVSITRNCGHHVVMRLPLVLAHRDRHVDAGDVMRVVARTRPARICRRN